MSTVSAVRVRHRPYDASRGYHVYGAMNTCVAADEYWPNWYHSDPNQNNVGILIFEPNVYYISGEIGTW